MASSHHSIVVSSAFPVVPDRFCLDCDAFVQLNQHSRCDICDSSAISTSPASQTDINLGRLVAVVRQSRGAA